MADRPLQGVGVLVTRPRTQAIELVDAIEAAGELGVGFTLATHDMEIRGAGELPHRGRQVALLQVGDPHLHPGGRLLLHVRRWRRAGDEQRASRRVFGSGRSELSEDRATK